MRERKDFDYYTYEVGRYEPGFLDDKESFIPYKHETKKLVWNVFEYDINARKIRPINLFEYNWVFLEGLVKVKKQYGNNFEKFAENVRRELHCQYWARSQYETIISQWPPNSLNQKDLDELQAKLTYDKVNSSYPEYCHVYPDMGTCYKMDVYTQVMMNWDRFIEYLWVNKRLITKKKLGLE